MKRLLRKDVPGLTILPFFIKAVSLAMFDFPLINSVVDPELDDNGYIKEFVVKNEHNFNIAIDSDEGLLYPVIKNIQEKSILDINGDLRSLISRERNNELTSDDFEGGTFSVSSVGNIGGRYLTT